MDVVQGWRYFGVGVGDCNKHTVKIHYNRVVACLKILVVLSGVGCRVQSFRENLEPRQNLSSFIND
jgi:hypothetical protein